MEVLSSTIGSQTTGRSVAFGFTRIKWSRLCIVLTVALMAGSLLLQMPLAHAIPPTATTCTTTDCAASSKGTNALQSGPGQTTGYTGNNSNIEVGLNTPSLTSSALTSAQTPGSLSDFWSGNAYFERSHYLTPNGGGLNLDEAAPFPTPGTPGTGPNTIYTYYRSHGVPNHDGIGLVISDDGGASYHYYNNGIPIVNATLSDSCAWDAQNAMMPSVVKVGSEFFMVYEGASISLNIPGCLAGGHYVTFGDIGLATSPDGLIWNKYNGNGLFLKHNLLSSWECNNIGGPSVNYFNGQFYVFFHGNCGIPTSPATYAICVASSLFAIGLLTGLAAEYCAYGGTPCTTSPSCLLGFRFDGMRNKTGMVSAAGTDLTQLQSSLQNSVNGASPIVDVGVGAQSWDSRVNGRPNVIQEGGYYYLFFEGSQYVYCQTYPNGSGANEGNWGWGVARTLDINNGPWQKYSYNPIQQLFQNQGSGCGIQQPYVFKLNGAYRVYVWNNWMTGFSDVLLSGTDPYLHLYPAVNNGQGQCELNHKIGSVDNVNAPTGWAQATGFLVLPNRLCYGPYQSFATAGQYSSGIPAGDYAVTFENLIDSTSDQCFGCNPVIYQDITYAGGSNTVSSMQLYRRDFQFGWSYQDFEQQFRSQAGSSYSYEWRTDWDATAYTRLHWVALRQLMDSADKTNPANSQIDTTPPTASLNPLAADSFQSFAISWGGSDSQTGIWSYDVQYQDNGGPWMNLNFTDGAACCMGTTATSFTLPPQQCYHTYSFQVRARDQSGNVGAYSSPVSTYIPCDFTMSNSQSSWNQMAGGSITTTLMLTPGSGFTGSVTLSSTPPTGMSVTFNPVTVSLASGSAVSSVTFSAASNMALGSYSINLKAASGSSSHSITVNVQVILGITYQQEALFTQAGGVSGSNIIALVNTPVSMSITLIAVGPITGWVGVEVMQDYGYPAVYNYQWNQYLFTLSAGSNYLNMGSFTPGDLTNPNFGYVHQYYITVYWNGINIYNPVYQSGQETVQTTSSDFALSSNTPINVAVGSSTTSVINVNSRNSFSGTVTFSLIVGGITISTPPSVSVPAGGSITSRFTITAGPQVGTYTIVFSGSSGSLVRYVALTIRVVDFFQASIPGTINVQQGASGRSTIILGSLNGFSGTVSLTTSAPSGFTLSLNTTSILLDPTRLQPAVLSVNVASSVAIGNYTVTVYETSGSLQHSTTITVQVSNFALTVVPSAVSAQRGGNTSVTLILTSINGYSGPASFTVTSIPGCVSYSFSLSSEEIHAWGTNSSTLFLYPGLGCTPSANTSVSVQASSGANSLPASFSLTITDFSIQASPTSVTTLAGVTSSSTITINPINGFTGTVNLASTTSQSGLTCTLSPTSITGSGTSTLSCSGLAGQYTVTITGTSGSLAHPATVAYTVQDFSISPSSSTVPVLVGQTATATLSVASLNGFAGTVSLSDTPLPSGLTCNSISPSSITLPPSPASATLSCSTTIIGTYTVTILASSGSLSHTATVTFTVQDYTISISPTSETIIGSNTGVSTVTITPVNGFANIVSLTASPSPSGLYCYFSPNTITGSGTATMYCYGSAGTYTATITGTVGSFTHSATATITVRDFSISASPSSISIPDGRSGSLTVQATSLNGYTGTIVLGVSNLYCGTQSFSKPSIHLTSGGSNTSILTLNIGSNCNASQYNAYVTGYDSSAQVSRAGSLIVNTSDFSIVGQVGTTVGIGGQTTLKYNVTYYDNNNYPGSILTQTNSFGVNNCCLSTTIPTTFSIARPDSNSAPGLVTSLNIQTQSFSDPWNGQGFYAQGRDWIFFIYYGTCSGTTTNCLYYATSTNGAAWTIYNTGLVTGSTPSIVTNGTAVFYVRYDGVDTQSGRALMLGVGTLHTDGTIAWQPEKTVKPATSGVFWYAMSMRVSTTGQVFVAYNKLTSAYGSGYPYVIHSNGVDYTTWQQDTSLINSNDDWRFSIVPLANGQMYILYWPYWGGLNGRLWSSGAWGSQVTITPSNTYVQQTAFGFSNGNSTVYAIWQERTSQKIQFATRTSSWSAPQTIFTADTGSNPRWTASYDPLHSKWYILYYSYSTNQIWEYSGQPGSWSGKTVLYTTTGASSNTMIGSFYNSGQVNSSTNTLGIFWTQYDSSLTTLQLKYANATIFTGGSFPSTWPITSTGAGSGATTLTVTASDGYITRSLTLQLTINGYNVTYYYNPLPVNQGSSTAIYLQIFPEYGIPLTQATVSPVTVPSCITVSPPNPQFFNIGPIGGYDFPTVPVAASSTCTVGNYQVTVKINGTSVHTYDKLLTFTVTVTTPPPSGGGGGSVAAGTLITLADGSQVPVQSLKVGMQLLSYNMTTHQYTTITITRFVTVQTDNLMIIHTSTGKPLIVDQNPAQKLEVMFPNGTWTELSVTQLQVGDYLFDATTQTWVPVTSIQYEKGGVHTMYDIYTDVPTLNYVANNYLDYVKV